MRNLGEAKDTAYTLHSVMKDYLKQNSPVSPVLPQSAIVLDAPQTLLTQVYGVNYEFK